MNIIEINSLTKVYTSNFNKRQVKALDKLTLTVPEGSIFGLIGPNGAGKTTLVKLLLGIALPTEGSISIFCKDYRDSAIKSDIGYLPENHRFPLNFTGHDILKYFGMLSGLESAVLNERIPKLLYLVGMGKWADAKIKTYSKGMMQRIGLAQALINDPKLIFLDEPTDGIDPMGRIEIREILLNLRSQGKTIFLNSHLLAEVEQITDKIAILDKGQLVRSGGLSEMSELNASYIIRVEGDIKLLTPDFNNKFTLISGDSYSLNISSDLELNLVIDNLRKNNILIKEIVYQKASLESLFISSLKDKEKTF
ncbi:MAG: ABC transporter ATP-binding protein [Bacteroidota bacterium]|nr:ABC transporter ATP-binding protein [Bacteroidota bacterium]